MAHVGDILRKHDIKIHMYADDIQIFLDFDPTIPGEADCCLYKLSSCISDVQKCRCFITNENLMRTRLNFSLLHLPITNNIFKM